MAHACGSCRYRTVSRIRFSRPLEPAIVDLAQKTVLSRYTLQGPLVTGQSNASLTIYQNSGGNFDAPPPTNPQPVGTATLSFNACSSGQLAYSFTDGTGRAGTIPLTRLLPNVTCSAKAPRVANADYALSGNWYAGAATSGQGFTAEVAPNIGAFFLSWFTYAPNGAASGAAGERWYTAQGAFTPGLRTIPVQIYETTGGTFDAPPSARQATVAVGTRTMTFKSCSAGTFSYSFTGGSSMGRSGMMTLSRVGPVPPGCQQRSRPIWVTGKKCFPDWGAVRHARAQKVGDLSAWATSKILTHCAANSGSARYPIMIQ